MVAIALLFGSALILDQVTKAIVRQSMVLGQSIPLVGDFLSFTYVENPGIAFGIRLGNGTIFTVLSLLASLGILVYLITHWDEPMGIKSGLALILGGAFGNLIDRILFGKVVDFIEMGIGQYRWPVYNIADAAVVIGMGILLITVFRHERRLKEKELTSSKE
ncbi:signal peptidase II [bacterium]|nr:signal peptidase II [bacterium]